MNFNAVVASDELQSLGQLYRSPIYVDLADESIEHQSASRS